MFRRSKPMVGLDIGSSAVKAVELKPAGKAYRVAAFGMQPVPPDSIVDGAIIDAGAVAGAIRRIFEGNKAFKAKDVCASLSGNAVIVKKITLPVMTEAELNESIYWEAEQYIPFDIQDVNLDYQILDPGTGPDSRGSMDVLLVAAKKEKIGDYTSVIAQAGRTPVIVVNGVTAAFTFSPTNPKINEGVLFNAEESRGSDTGFGSRNKITKFLWNFGMSEEIQETSSPRLLLSNGFPNDRTYTVTLTVEDSAGRRQTIFHTVAISN